LVVLEESTSVDLVVDEKIVHLSSYDSEAVNENHVIELNLGSRAKKASIFKLLDYWRSAT
jgi:hypothetical protein